jgi:hypothetical protein
VLKEEPGDRFDPDYMDDICSGTFEKGTLFLPIENNEVDFSNEMVNISALLIQLSICHIDISYL